MIHGSQLARAAASGAGRFAAAARDLIFPPHCPGCGGALAEGSAEGLCAECRGDLPRLQTAWCARCGAALATAAASCTGCRGDSAIDALVHATAYAGTARRLVQRFKYEADFAAGRLLARLLAECVRTGLPGGADLLVPVPLHRRRLGARGFNQAALLARACGRQLGLPVDVAALRRVRRTRALAGLHPEERVAEVAGAFTVRRPGAVAGRRVLLVDDVLTTGATAEGCCRALREAGAAWTAVAVAARVLRPLSDRLRIVDAATG